MGSDLKELNVTGKDSYFQKEWTGEYYFVPPDDTFSGGFFKKYHWVKHLRRYLVTDETGRHIDPRTIKSSSAAKTKKNPELEWSLNCMPGSKQHWHRQGGPSMHRSQLRCEQEPAELVDCDDEPVKPVRNHSGVRRPRGSMGDDIWWFYDKKGSRGYYMPKCWKNQTKARRQWQRHDPHHDRQASKYAADAVQASEAAWDAFLAEFNEARKSEESLSGCAPENEAQAEPVPAEEKPYAVSETELRSYWTIPGKDERKYT